MKKIIMKYAVHALGILCLLNAAPTLAFEELGVGIAAFKPTGLSFKLWASRLTAFDLETSWNFNSDEYRVHADYLRHNYDLLDAKENGTIFYSGYGVRAEHEHGEDTSVGLRLPFGVTYLMEDPNIEFFGELAPRIDVAPSTRFGLDIILGLRYRIGGGHGTLE